MHKEVRKQKKVVAIIISLIAITFALYIYQYTKIVIVKNGTLEQMADILLIVVVIFILAKEFRRCKISYKYSIISDKLIINKISNKVEENIESLKIKDIIFLGKQCNLPKKYTSIRCHKYYTKDFNINNKICCVYKKGDKIIKFVFDPSNTFIEHVNEIS